MRSTAFSLIKDVYVPKDFIHHAASLHQAFAHCGRFSTAAIRRCMGRHSVFPDHSGYQTIPSPSFAKEGPTMLATVLVFSRKHFDNSFAEAKSRYGVRCYVSVILPPVLEFSFLISFTKDMIIANSFSNREFLVLTLLFS